jgi:DNA-binding CsgD family transcriptional regulator
MQANDPSSRLTEREKEALRLWLDRRTAEEIALDLGISHHAVEKRLKMARTKLGAATSLEAARILAEAEGYGQTVTGLTDLAADAPVTPMSRQSSRPMIGKWSLSTMIGMSTAAAALLIGSQGTSAIDPDAPAPALERSLEQEIAAAHSLFERMDRDSSGILEQAEFVEPFSEVHSRESDPSGQLVIVEKGELRGRVVDPQTIKLAPRGETFIERRRAMFRLIDRNEDGAIDKEEFAQGQIEGIGPRTFTVELATDEG